MECPTRIIPGGVIIGNVEEPKKTVEIPHETENLPHETEVKKITRKRK